VNQQTKDKFIILKKMKYGEADLILHALSSHGAKVSFIARAALKSKKRFGGGVLEPSHFVQFTYRPTTEEGKLNVLQEATLLSDFQGIRRSYDHLEFALHAVECVAKVSQEGDQSSEFLFNLLGHTLKAAETAEDVLILKMQFYLKFLLQQGVMEAEPWMTPFLRANISETNTLQAHKEQALAHLFDMDTMVRHYLQNATL
jgi:DNA repair protein RecO (recombination protein O)